MRTCTAVLLVLLLIAVLLFGIFLLAPFPIWVFPAIVKTQVYLKQEKDGQFPTATYFWSKLPAIQYYEFYYFNITNPDEVLYKGAKARLIEVGPYVWAETEFKQDIDFRESGKSVYYRNNKTWVYSPEESCDGCNLEDNLMLSNPSYMTLLSLLGNPLTLPNIPAMGYFPLYNHTCDEDYVAKTGSDNTNNFQKPGLKKSDRLKQFQSFACRSFYLHYDSDTSVNGINTMRFAMDDDTYNTTMEINKGYRYENKEMVSGSFPFPDYFPSWPCGLNHTYTPGAPGCSSVDCSLYQNWCNKCCNGTHYGSTVFLPPGINPLRCLPGQNQVLPFAGFLSPPHFLWSPPEVQNNVIGLKPDPALHHPGLFDIQPVTGSTVNARFRMQLSVPIYNNPLFTECKQVRNSFLPSFWVGIRVAMRDYAHDYIYFNTTTLPHIVLGLGIGFVGVSILTALLVSFFILRRKGAFKRSGRRLSWTPDL
ncbi:unnamed protein product [Nippostrongylus brasiliensis]|uniref:Scavenger receptor class B member 1 n=1 Tax=Nippostrongylus brasiliensis TaxID=27835 RepID=A0A158QYV9_NIPBR|nr:unnamed protein product [Nippostrongylus brasiliensis]